MGSRKKHRKQSTSSSEDSEDDKKSKKRRNRAELNKKRKHVSSSSSSSTTSSSSSSSSSTDSEEERRRKKKLKRLKKSRTEKKVIENSADIPIDLMSKSKAMAPMTKEEWEKRQSVVKRVFDESTGRHRLIKGDGEVIEEIVSRDRHKAINQQATRGDGDYFQARVSSQLKK